jgi:hypothetical protein
LQHVYEVLDISPTSRDLLLNTAKIKTIACLLRATNRLRHTKHRGIRKHPQRELFKVLCWLNHFQHKNSRAPNWLIEFDEDIFHGFLDKVGEVERATRRMDVDSIPDLPKLGEHLYQMYKEGLTAEFEVVLASDEKRNALVNCIAGKVQDNLSMCLKDNCYFEIDKVAVMTVETLLSTSLGPDAAQATRPLLAHGKTQSGKSAYTAVVNAMCIFMGVRVILVTTSKSESIELCSKLVKYAEGGIAEGKIFSLYRKDTEEAGMTELEIFERFIDFNDEGGGSGGGALIVPATGHKIEAAVRLIKKYKVHCETHQRASKFALIEDECDSMLRTKDGTLLMEQALTKLRSLQPSLHVLVTATPAPVLLVYKNEYGIDLEIFSIGTSDDYVGLDQMEPLRDANNDPVYLDRLSYASGNIAFDVTATYDNELSESLFEDDNLDDRFYSDTTQNSTIPCTNDDVKLLYDTALSTADKGARGILVLDRTLSRINVDGNVFQKAGKLQDMYHAEGTPFVVMTYVGSGISYRFPGQKHGHHCSSKRKIGDVIKMIDESDNFGLDTPVFVFGYTKMDRVISYRSNLRVPTHMVLYLGDGHSIEKMIQALGRATFNGKSLLEANGHKAPIVLNRRSDANVAPKHDECMIVYEQRFNGGETWDEILHGKNSRLPDSANYLRLTPRRTGQRPKKHDIGKYHDRNAFEDPPDELDETEDATKEKYWSDDMAQRILYVLYDLTTQDDDKYNYETDDIVEAYNDTYCPDFLCKTPATTKLKELKRASIVREIDVTETQESTTNKASWKLEYPERVRRLFLNKEYTPQNAG